jgi:outer membrane protein OmpA-like peptidoglycan-associated protein
MLGRKVGARHRGKDEAEKPFWISFADLMSALMVLFLVVMSAALLSVTKTITKREQQEKQRAEDIEQIVERFKEAASRFPGISVTGVGDRRVIDFGERAQFPFNSSSLSGEQQKLLREFVPEILVRANDELGKRILKRIVVEGFTDKTGKYLFNLNLSLQRSQRVLCAMFGKPLATERPLTVDEKNQIRALFLVGGYSFNAAKDTDEESRRVEMRLEFLGIEEVRPETANLELSDLGICALE